ncbi:DUF11 domain-containing protein [Candidatus Saccharibacteria bacterium]|nr:DUF11 domain-containing protein [Candidatus Saccharibacteria bacterium]
MSKLLDKLRKGNTRIGALVAIVAAAIIIPATLYAWGPDRPTYTIERPADHVTFNSITNNPNIGDERNFVGIREATAPNVWHDDMQVERGKEYVVRMYVHNNAASNLNKVAENTTARITLPTATGTSVQVDGSVSANNASPQMVYDHATFKSSENFNIAYIPGTLKYENNVFGANGTALPESIFTSAGALLGYDKLDGKIPGCFEYAGYVSFKVKPQFAQTPPSDFTVQKQVRKEGATDGFKETTAVNPGDTVDYRIEVKNTGGAPLKNVALKDQLPTGMSFVPGTVKILNANNPSGALVQDGDKLVSSGINIGEYTPGSNAFVVFKAKVAANAQLPVCGPNTLTNKASAQPEGQNPKDDTADVTVPKECQPEAAYKCTALAVNKLSDTKFKFEAGYTVTGGTFKSVSYVVRNEAGATVATVNGAPNAAEYTQATPGKYTVQATVTFTVNGQDVTATSEACKKAFEVPAPEDKKIIVCEIATKKIVTIKESEFDASKYSKDLNDCKEVPSDIIVCDLTTKEVVTIKESEFDSSKYSKDLKDCAEAPKENCPIPGKEHMPKDSPDCKVTPVTPTELPQTGSNDGVLTIAGLATLALVLGYAVTARRTIG